MESYTIVVFDRKSRGLLYGKDSAESRDGTRRVPRLQLPEFWVEAVPEPIPEQVERQHHQGNSDAWPYITWSMICWRLIARERASRTRTSVRGDCCNSGRYRP